MWRATPRWWIRCPTRWEKSLPIKRFSTCRSTAATSRSWDCCRQGSRRCPRGLQQSGGSLRNGQGYAVNGQRPESNAYRVDGASNVNRMDGGFALRIPVDAIAEFRILTHTAPPEYGGTSGSTTSVVTRSGTNRLHGSAYEFLRNDVLDARNFFSASVEPLKQNQFGAHGRRPDPA